MFGYGGAESMFRMDWKSFKLLVETNIMQQKFGPVDLEHTSSDRITVAWQ